MPSANRRPDQAGPPAGRRPSGAAFLLAQLGAHAATRFAERVSQMGLTAPLAGLLGAVARDPGSSQQQIATRLGLLPSRVVAFVDDLEGRGLVYRERSTVDRRQYGLHLTKAGQAVLRRIGELARAHDRELCKALTAAEREQLAALLGRLVQQQGLTPGVHPGYRQVDPPAGRNP